MNTNMTGFRWFSKVCASLCFGSSLSIRRDTAFKCILLANGFLVFCDGSPIIYNDKIYQKMFEYQSTQNQRFTHDSSVLLVVLFIILI